MHAAELIQNLKMTKAAALSTRKMLKNTPIVHQGAKVKIGTWNARWTLKGY